MTPHPTHPWIKTAYTPVYQLTYPSYDATDPVQLTRYTQEQQRLYKILADWTKLRTRAYSFVVDLGQAKSSAMSRQRAIEYNEYVKQRGSPYLACRAYVTPNDEVRGVMTAVFWRSTPDFPHAFFKTVEEARPWALEHTLALDVQQSRASAKG